MFQFPSNGKAHSDLTAPPKGGHNNFCFNSLQTGRHIQTISIESFVPGTDMFQFPSNGKAHSDISPSDPRRHLWVNVSIPFKREGTFRHFTIRPEKTSMGERFNSLQTGRHIQTFLCRPIWQEPKGRFQFPSNGKAHSDPTLLVLDESLVAFQFPSNGKAHSDHHPLTPPWQNPNFVSIPFKREGTFRLQSFGQCEVRAVRKVSIPFKREGTFRPGDG